MATSQNQPKIAAGNSLDNSDNTSNVATNSAQLAALANANIDGKDAYPHSLSTGHLSAADGDFQGVMRSGAILAGSDGVTITSDPLGGTPNTGISMSDSQFILYSGGDTKVQFDGKTGNAQFSGDISGANLTGSTMSSGSIDIGSGGVSIAGGDSHSGTSIAGNIISMKHGDVTKVQINGNDGTASFAGEVDASKFILASNAANSVNVGANTTIGGDLIITDSGAAHYIQWTDATHGTKFLYGDGTSFALLHTGASGVITIQAGSSGLPDTAVGSVSISANTVDLNAPTAVRVMSGGTTILQVAASGKVSLGSATGPTIHVGAAPSEGDASAEPLGSLLMSTGGSLWLTHLDTTNKWTKVK